MVSGAYLAGRTKWFRPQAMVWSNVPFLLKDGGYIPPEFAEEGIDFIVITDHSRDAINMSPNRIESRSRMINGTSRSHHTADKYTISTSWSDLPSRIAQNPVAFDPLTGARIGGGDVYIADDASAALDIKQWYETHPGNFYLYLSYDMGAEFDTMDKYVDQRLVYFESFSSSISKRGLYDFWNIDVSLGEV